MLWWLQKYFGYIFKVKAEVYFYDKLLLASVSVFNSQYGNCCLYADSIYFSIIYKAVFFDGKAMSVESCFCSMSPFLWYDTYYRYIIQTEMVFDITE